MLARLGLRASDLAQLRLGEIEWESGALRVKGLDFTIFATHLATGW